MSGVNGFDKALFQKRLRKRLKDLDISQKEAAARSGVSQATIEKWLNGKSEGRVDQSNNNKSPYIPSLDTICKVAAGLGVSIDYFVNPDFDCLTVSNQMIHDYIGLSDAAINALIEDKKRPLHIIDTINLLLGNVSKNPTIHKLFLDIYMYLLTNPKWFKSLDGTFKDNYIMLESEFDNAAYPSLHGLGIGLYTENVGGLFLQNITSHLSVIKDHLTPKS